MRVAVIVSPAACEARRARHVLGPARPVWDMQHEILRLQGRAAARLVLCGLLAWIGAVLCAGAPVWAQQAAPAQEAAAAAAGLLGPEELRKLVAPIALYPDDLLAIVLPASTNPVQIVAAQRFLEKRKKEQKLQPNAEWDPSILALLNYPSVIAKMNDDIEWTTALGNAVIDQLDDVMDMIQQLRAEASADGYLQSNEYQVVIWEDDYWHIDSSDPDYIYIPDYPPEVVLRPEHPIVVPPGSPPLSPQHPIAYPPPTYATQLPYWSPGATFFAGALLGAAFGYGLNWGGGDIDINYGANCCRGGNINIGNDVNIGSGNRVDHRVGDRFNADKQRVNGNDKLKWNGNKARQKAATGKPAAARNKAGTLPAKKAGAGAAAKPKQLGTAGARQKPRAGDLQPSRGNGGSLGTYQSDRDASKFGNKGSQSLRNSRSKPAGALSNDNRSRSNAGAFGGYGSGSSVYRQSTRGGSSFRSSGGGRRGGGGGRRR
jgi:uncharacterized protein DUF3300